jgi:putative acetyltransferase
MSPINIREASIKDIDQIISLCASTIAQINIKDYNQAQVDAWVNKVKDTKRWKQRVQSQYFIVSEISGKITGFSSITDEGYLDLMYVHSDFQGRHIASSLLSVIEEHAQWLKLDEIITEASITARPFFEKKGFITLSRQIKKINKVALPNFLMMKKINLS